MVNLTIRLSKDAGLGAASSKVAAGVELAPLISSGPPACLDHLELDELTPAAAVGSPTINATVNILGRKCQRKLGSKVHFCVRCNFPIAIYGRLDPCEHVFCLICAKKDPICFLCEERIIRIQKLEVLEGIYICGAPGCLRSFIKKPELEGHIEDTHKALLHRLDERDEKAEILLQTQSHPEQTPTVQGQSLPVFPPLPPQPQQPRQPQPQSSEDKLVQVHAKQSPSISSNFQREEKQLRPHQPKLGNHQQDRHGHQKQQQQQHPQHQEQHQHAHISQKKSQQNIHDNHPQRDHHQQHAQQLQQHQGQQEKQHRPSHLEKQQLQHPERSLHMPPQNQQGMLPPFLAQSFPSSYYTQSDKNHLQQPHALRYDSPKFGPSIDHRMPVHPGVPDFQEKSRPRHSGNASTDREGGLSSNGHQEGFMSIDRQPLMPHYHSEYGPRGPQMTGKALDHPPHFQEVAKQPAPKRGKYGPSPPIGEVPADTLTSAWAGGTSKFAPGPGFVG